MKCDIQHPSFENTNTNITDILIQIELKKNIKANQLPITSIMGHLVGHVLSETKFTLVDANFDQKQMDTRKKIAQCFVIYQFLEKNK
jgi:hypothetical protein